jgi:hypothetical protein
MVTEAVQLERAAAPPAEWAFLPPWDGEQGTLWQVWMRERGVAYWLMKAAVKFVNSVGRREAALRGRDWQDITSPFPLEEGGTFTERDRAEDLCRIARLAGKAATICPVIIGRAYSVERVEAAGEFDPFKTFDFSATEAVREQAKHMLIPIEHWEQVKSYFTGISETAKPRL